MFRCQHSTTTFHPLMTLSLTSHGWQFSKRLWSTSHFWYENLQLSLILRLKQSKVEESCGNCLYQNILNTANILRKYFFLILQVQFFPILPVFCLLRSSCKKMSTSARAFLLVFVDFWTITKLSVTYNDFFTIFNSLRMQHCAGHICQDSSRQQCAVGPLIGPLLRRPPQPPWRPSSTNVFDHTSRHSRRTRKNLHSFKQFLVTSRAVSSTSVMLMGTCLRSLADLRSATNFSLVNELVNSELNLYLNLKVTFCNAIF